MPRDIVCFGQTFLGVSSYVWEALILLMFLRFLIPKKENPQKGKNIPKSCFWENTSIFGEILPIFGKSSSLANNNMHLPLSKEVIYA